MFKKLFASLGVGGASVDTRLHQSTVQPGGPLSGEVVIRGGDVAQVIEHVALALMTEVEVERGDNEYRSSHSLGSVRVAGRQEVQPGQEIRLPFSFTLPLELPLNAGFPSRSGYQPHIKAPVWVETDLAIERAVDATDRDFLAVQPTPAMQRFLAAMDNIGFTLVRVDIEQGTARAANRSSTLGCYQEFEFKPAGGSWSIAEVEVTFLPGAHDIAVLIEIDRRFRGDGYLSLTIGPNWQSVNWEAELQRMLG